MKLYDHRAHPLGRDRVLALRARARGGKSKELGETAVGGASAAYHPSRSRTRLSPVDRERLWPEGTMHARFAVVVVSGLFAGCDSNSQPTFGDTGLPKNCRAIITFNIEGWRARTYKAEDALESINRNCGRNGYS